MTVDTKNGGWLLLSGGLVVDGTGREPVAVSVLIDGGGRIAGVGDRESLEKRAEGSVSVVDVSGRWLTPGLVNAHEHLCLKDALVGKAMMAYYEIYKQPAETQVLRGARGALVSLVQGVTTVRDAGAMGQLAVQVRDGIDSGLLVGPRTATCGSPISVPFEGEGVNPAGMTVDAVGVDEVRNRVQWLLERGVDFIKVKGHRRDFSSPRTKVYSDEEIAAAVDEGHDGGVKVSLHAWHVEVIEAAVRFGADCVEHGNPMADQPDLAKAMADSGVAFVPNVTSWAPEGGPHDLRNQQAATDLEKVWPSTQMALEAGVKVGVGTDLYTARMSQEMIAFQELGLSALETITAATKTGAEILGWDSEIGTIEEGKVADIAVLASNPLEDLTAFDEPESVYLNGRELKPEAIRQAIGPEALAGVTVSLD